MENYFKENLANYFQRKEDEDKEYTEKEIEILEENIDTTEEIPKESKEIDFVNQEINILLKTVEKTKFKNRLKYINDNNEVKFYLDNRFLTNVSEDTIKSFYCTGDLSEKILKVCYDVNGVYELKLFIDKYCTAFNDFLPISARITRKEFTDKYLDFLNYELKSKNKVNLNKLNKYLFLNYNEKIIKSGSKRWLTHLTFKSKIKEGSNDIFSDNSLVSFINDYCLVSNNITPKKRISRANFKKGYIAYCIKNDLIPLDVKSFNSILQKKYGENFIKSNGIYYMRKIKFKNF